MPIIHPLSEITPDEMDEVGGKAGNLATLLRAGLPVPAAFVVSASAFQQVIEANDLDAAITRHAEVICEGTLAHAKVASAAIEALFLAVPLPDDIARALCDAYAALGGGAVAVRSSATAEDLPNASFAGQYTTLLNVEGADALLRAVRLCWASFWTPQATRYRARQGISDAHAHMAVIIQRMVPARVSGVLFTHDPTRGDDDEMVINATWGLGEALVSGQVTPDTFIVRRDTGALVRADLRAAQATLTDEQARRLAALGAEVEQLFGCPQDIEWALGDDFALLQARAITTQASLAPVTMRQEALPVPGDDTWDRSAQPSPTHPYDLWTRANFGENFPDPITPLTMTAWPLLLYAGRWPGKEERQAGSAAPSAPGRRFYGRLYVNEGAMLHISAELGIPRDFLDTVWGSGQGPRTPDDGRFHFLRMARRLPGLIRELAAQTPPSSQTARKPSPETPHISAQRLDAQVSDWAAEFARENLRSLPDDALWLRWIPLLTARGKALTSTIAPTAMLAALWFYLLESRLRRWTGISGQTATLTQALNGISSAEVGPALWNLAQALRADGLDAIARAGTPAEALAALRARPDAAFEKQFAAFLDFHGFRCPNDNELRNPRWADAPEAALALVCAYLDVDAARSPAAVAARARAERESLTQTIDARLNPFRRGLFRFLLARTQSGVRARDNHRSSATRFLHPVRQLFVEFGRRWAERGWLASADDIFFLTAFEVEDIALAGEPYARGCDLRRTVETRRAAFDYWTHITPPAAIEADGTPAPEPSPIGVGNTLVGTGASAGRARGQARLIHSVAEASRLEPGDIMVATATDPGWTAIFPLASGLVIEVGGQLAHAAIVAREYGIPAVVNIPGVMQTIRDGQMIEVDGATGRVTLLREEDAKSPAGDALSKLE